jgi:3-isopropylmalate dehydrogenase
MLLRHSLGLESEAQSIERAVEAALAAGARTRDLSPTAEKPLSTSAMGDAVVSHLA